MTAPRISIAIEPDRLGERLRLAARFGEAEMASLVRRIAATAETNVAERTPVGHTGSARGGWTSELRRRGGRPVGSVINPVFHIPNLEEPRGPGRPPPTQALVPWVGSKLGISEPERTQVAFLIARKIGRSGVRPNRGSKVGPGMIRRGWAATRKEIRPELRKAGLRMTKPLRS